MVRGSDLVDGKASTDDIRQTLGVSSSLRNQMWLLTLSATSPDAGTGSQIEQVGAFVAGWSPFLRI